MQMRIIALLAPALLLAGAASAQEQTERFIPIGKSPGISGVYAYLGTIQAADAQHRTITVANDQEMRTIQITDTTDIWMDRSAIRQTNLVGNWSDLEVGRTVEIKYLDFESKDVADWVKIAIGGQ